MSDLPADELRRMARAIDAGLEPRLHIELEISAEGAARLQAVLEAVSADLLIENSWPLLRMADMLDAALA